MNALAWNNSMGPRSEAVGFWAVVMKIGIVGGIRI